MTYRAGLVFCVFFFLFSCKEKKKPSLSGEDQVELADFIDSYDLKREGYSFGDTILTRKENDSLRISATVFKQFVPDSVLKALAGNASKPLIYPLARVEASAGEIYLFSKLVAGTKRQILVTAFNPDKTYGATMSLLEQDNNRATSQSGGIDRRMALFRQVSMAKPGGPPAEGKEVYAYDASLNSFSLILTESLDDKLTEVIIPIDTLPVKNKYSGDYSKDKMNLIAIRDAKKSGHFQFFIHIEQNKGQCSGEIRGEARFTGPAKAIYSRAGDPCKLEFSFSSTAVSLKEINPCGNWRGLECAFDSRYPKKKKTVKKTSGN